MFNIFITVDCQWGCWEVGNCTKECGTGYVFQRREILIPAMNSGNDCSGDSYRVSNMKCNTDACPGKTNETVWKKLKSMQIIII